MLIDVDGAATLTLLLLFVEDVIGPCCAGPERAICSIVGALPNRLRRLLFTRLSSATFAVGVLGTLSRAASF